MRFPRPADPPTSFSKTGVAFPELLRERGVAGPALPPTDVTSHAAPDARGVAARTGTEPHRRQRGPGSSLESPRQTQWPLAADPVCSVRALRAGRDRYRVALTGRRPPIRVNGRSRLPARLDLALRARRWCWAIRSPRSRFSEERTRSSNPRDPSLESLPASATGRSVASAVASALAGSDGSPDRSRGPVVDGGGSPGTGQWRLDSRGPGRKPLGRVAA
jgi:hypothetical protein